MPLTFSIIIPTAKITSFLTGKTLPAIFTQTQKSFEIIIVTNQNNFSKIDKRVKIIKTKIKNPGKMRNLAAQKAQGSILVFIDDDVYPSPNWLKQIEKKNKFSQNYCRLWSWYHPSQFNFCPISFRMVLGLTFGLCQLSLSLFSSAQKIC